MKNRTEVLVEKLKLSEILKKTMNIFDSGLYYEVTISSWKGCYSGSL